jgi:hypothetical protein
MRIQENYFVEIKFLTVFYAESLQLCHYSFRILIKLPTMLPAVVLSEPIEFSGLWKWGRKYFYVKL